jgi:hypothetical protein
MASPREWRIFVGQVLAVQNDRRRLAETKNQPEKLAPLGLAVR